MTRAYDDEPSCFERAWIITGLFQRPILGERVARENVSWRLDADARKNTNTDAAAKFFGLQVALLFSTAPKSIEVYYGKIGDDGAVGDQVNPHH